ncbi:FAD-dependent oxidoreductase [Actinoplanes sp. ATCC 53533]|uniref:NAD(P)/FAD-dependent oxidoreductase n=1 Tax=Actinoplanes sp. ATCC 53533 TaxID=1288362 RepID=UPI000F798279|nr:FAD-dependent oxidoreductase [Actinoplanes sp. ATCC 53533]RSM72547.1 FAD-dependent oxidoreductase [Actinoplanes sp. ATCC 53533]
MADIKQVIVIGAGYTGMLAALGAAKRAKGRVHVTLVNPWERFTERLRMHQIATGQQLAEHRIPDLVAGTGIDFVRGWASGIDTAARTVTVSTVDDGEVFLGYDTLVYAIGSTTDTGRVPGAAEHAFTLNDPRSAQAMAAHLARRGTGEFLVCGAGLTGIEAATEIAESHPNVRVTLLSRGEPAAMMGARARAYLMAALDRLGVTVRAGVSVTKVLAGGVELEGGEFVAGDGCLWTTGVRVAPLAAEAGIATDEYGRIRTDAMLRSVSHPGIYAIGDAAAVPQAFGVIHGTCQSGIPTAAHAAENIARQLRGKQLKPFRFGYLHQPVSLGRRDAVIQFTYGDDTPRRWYLTGRAAIFYKETVSSSPIKTYGLAKRLAISSRMLATTGGKRNKPVGWERLGPASFTG